MTAGPLAAANQRRHETAGWRDAVLARRIIRDPAVWVLLDGFQRRIAETRAARTPATWAELAARLHVTKDTATGAWRHLLTWPQITRLKEAPMPEETPIVAWEDVEAALRATGCDRDEAWAAVPHSLVVVVPSVGAAMLFAAELTLRLTGFGGRLVHAPDEVTDVLARTSDSWVMTGQGEDLPVLALTFPGVIVTGDPPAGPPPGVDGTAAFGLGEGGGRRDADEEDAEYVRQHGGDDLDTGDLRDPEGDEAAHA